MIVVCNTSPIIALVCVGRLDMLRAVHGEILVPDAVFDEITVAAAGEPSASELAQAAWIKRRRWLPMGAFESTRIVPPAEALRILSD